MKIQIHPATTFTTNQPAALAVAAIRELRIQEHRRGLHAYGLMRRDCPLCQGGQA